ncbi:ATP-binding protein [Streptomyces broussonetiae]|uniref:ATP-binding protein n=1 Tax=Streptomyces broussonetiae TaxID=2686304 RepID=A0A6I6MSA5_9ACTN|nr:ATP-binding protein [Streptomyces broussonetiae]QHA03213.1 ATP-binding protein [Streptomyces broussonetiae]
MAPSGIAGARPSLGREARQWDLPHAPQAAGIARHLALDTLRGWGVREDQAHQVVLAVSELVTNAVEHALPPVALQLVPPNEHQTIHVAVTDGGPANDRGARTADCEPDEHGRGSAIIGFLASARGTRMCGRSATHWADLPLTA